jgi:Zn-dependent metalloprotease
MPRASKPITIFYSYSHKDERYRDDLASSLALLKRQGLIREWYDRNLVAGEKWEEAIYRELDAADVILLLISRDLINSDFIWGQELKRAMDRDAAGQARVIPIVVRPADWQASPLGALQALPKNAKPITLWQSRDAAWLDVATGIRAAIGQLQAGVKSKAARTVTPVTPIKDKRARSQAGSQKQGRRTAGEETGAALVATAALQRTIYTADNSERLPGRIARREGDPITGDIAVDEAYDYVGVTYRFFSDVFQRNSVDGNGLHLNAVVHYGKGFNNGFWNGTHIILGDGDGELFHRFSIALEVVAKEFANGVIQHDAQLEYWEQSGAILDSLAIAFASMVKQYHLKQTVAQADWLVGDRLIAFKGKALFSLAKPGTAYDNPLLGKDPQPAHMRNYVKTNADNGGVHINTGILNHAFYLAATKLGGYSWQHAGRVWYETMRDKGLKPKAQFADFARLTVDNAQRLFGAKSRETRAVNEAWSKVGVTKGRP